VGKKLGGDTAGRANPNLPREYPTLYDVMLNDKSWGDWKKEEEGMFKVMAFVFPRNSYT